MSTFDAKPGLSGREASYLFRLLAMARARNLPLLGAAEAMADLPDLPNVRRLLPHLRTAGEEGFLDVLTEAVSRSRDRAGAMILTALRRVGLPAAGLKDLADWFGGRHEARMQFVGAVSYPFTVMIGGALVAAFAVQFTYGSAAAAVGQQMGEAFGSASRPLSWMTRAFLALFSGPARMLQAGGLFPVLWVLVVAAFAALVLWSVPKVPAAAFALKLPLLGRFARLDSTRGFCLTLEVLLAHGVPDAEAFRLAAGAAPNAGVRRRLRILAARVEAGESAGELLREETAFPPLVRWRLWSAFFRSDFRAELPRVAAMCATELEAQGRRLAVAGTALSWWVTALTMIPVWQIVQTIYTPMFRLIE